MKTQARLIHSHPRQHSLCKNTKEKKQQSFSKVKTKRRPLSHASSKLSALMHTKWRPPSHKSFMLSAHMQTHSHFPFSKLDQLLMPLDNFIYTPKLITNDSILRYKGKSRQLPWPRGEKINRESCYLGYTFMVTGHQMPRERSLGL